jgi:hypothetical protein
MVTSEVVVGRPPGWQADVVLAVRHPSGLTEALPSGKTDAVAGSKQGMTTSRTRSAGCLSPGPPLDVVAWRACRLREAGFPPALADQLAAQRTDLHALLQLVDAGCPPELAARILSPVDAQVA